MNRRLFAASTLSAAVGLAMAAAVLPAQAQGMTQGMQQGKSQGMPETMPPIVKENMAKMQKQHLEKCYGINAVAKNDCAEGAHSCAGQATQARDPKSFVLLPAGDCSKIAGGSTKAA